MTLDDLRDSARPLVTAILPVHNRAGSIARAVESVLAQTWDNLELIVVDDGSTDATGAILDRYRDRIILLKQSNRGAYAARNLALRHARGELIAFIDSDDAWLPDRLERQIPLMRAGVALVYGNIEIVTAPRDDGPRARKTGFQEVRPNRGFVLDKFAWGNFVPTCAALVRKSAMDEVGGFSEDNRISSDYLTWFRIARRHRFDYVDAPVALYTRHLAGISYDLGRSLAARIALFRAERERTADPGTRRTIDKLLFNLGLHLTLAIARRRAGSVEGSLKLVRSAFGPTRPWRALSSVAAFVANQVTLRGRSLIT
jgi:glycosyltransferase involved in cell wall biosynthesis